MRRWLLAGFSPVDRGPRWDSLSPTRFIAGTGTGVAIQAAPAVWRRLALVNTGNGQLFAVDRFTRAMVWQTPIVDTRGQALLLL